MLFSSIGFLYYFLPLVLALYYLAPAKLKNMVLLGASLFFYFYGEPVFAVLILASSVLGYVHGLWISRCQTQKTARLALVSAVASGLFFLILFKYADFMIINLNRIPGLALPLPGLRLPIGISFYTFQILS
ncbi:MAG: MBOAT family protein, partial [Ruminococcaceae bacterium]|nr:MBOAT family protein [Oscillospiraceae bacterium]